MLVDDDDVGVLNEGTPVVPFPEAPPEIVDDASAPPQAAAAEAERSRASSSRAVFGPKCAAELNYVCDSGRITYYESSGSFAAYCSNPDHGRCVLTRTSRAGRSRGQGRPLGKLVAWLVANDQADARQHMKFQPDFESRCMLRALCKGDPMFDALCEKERPKNLESAEDSEPDVVS